MINNITIGEIIRIKGREWIIIEQEHSNGSYKWLQPELKLLHKLIKNDKRFDKPNSKYKKKFKGIKLVSKREF